MNYKNEISLMMATLVLLLLTLIIPPPAQAKYTLDYSLNSSSPNVPITDVAIIKPLEIKNAKISGISKNKGVFNYAPATLKQVYNVPIQGRTMHGLFINFDKLTKTDRLVIRWNKVAVDADGYLLDLELVISDFGWKNIPKGWKKFPVIGNINKSGDLTYMTPLNSGGGFIGSCQWKTTGTFYQTSGANTKAGGGGIKTSGKSFLAAWYDLDMSWGWGEYIKLTEANVASNKVILHSKTKLHKGDIQKGKFHGDHAGSMAGEDGEKKVGFAVALRAPTFSYIWGGGHCWTFQFALKNKTASVGKKTTNAYVGTVNGDNWKNTNSKWVFDTVPYNSNRTFIAKPAAGYFIDYIEIYNAKGKKTKLTGAALQKYAITKGDFKDKGYYKYTFNGVKTTASANSSKCLIYVHAKKASDLNISLKAKKKVTGGGTLKKGQFSFKLSGTKGVSGNVVATNAVNGDIVFNKSNAPKLLVFSGSSYVEGATLTRQLTLNEVLKSGGVVKYDNYIHDDTKFIYTIRVKCSGGNMVPTITVKKGKANGATVSGTPTFVNEFYYDPVSVTLSGSKSLSGKTLTAKQFSFQLLADNKTTVLQTVQNNKSGAFTFDKLTFSNPGTYKYYVKEVVPNGASDGVYQGITYDSDLRLVTIKITASNNKLSSAVSYKKNSTKVSKLSFSNKYSSSTSVTPKVYKTLQYGTLKASQFSFQLLDSSGNVLQTVKNSAPDATGKAEVSFSALKFTNAQAGKTLTYKIKEVAPGNGYTADTHVVTLKIALSDNGKGKLTAKASYNGSKTFANKVAVSTWIKIKKVYVNEGTSSPQYPLKGAVFGIYKDNSLVKSITTGSDGVATASGLAVGTYKVKEISAPPGYVKTSSVKTVTINSNDGVDLTSAPFVNTKSIDSFELACKKTLAGKTLTAGAFKFQLKNASGTVIQTKTNDEDGDVSFSPIKYSATDYGKTLRYYINEVNENSSHPAITYDTNVYEAVVTISSTGDANIQYRKKNTTTNLIGEPVFKNVYDVKGSAKILKLARNEGESDSQAVPLAGAVFGLYKNGSSTAMTKVSSGTDGIAVFSNLGEGSYKVKEISAPAGYAKDTRVLSFNIVKTAVIDLTGTPFVNVKKTSSFDISASKELAGGAQLAAGEFFFDLFQVASNGTETHICEVSNSEDGDISFPSISYTADDYGKTLKYRISEKDNSASDPDTTYDKSVYYAVVKINASGVATVGYSKSDGTALGGPPVFVNSREPYGSTTIRTLKTFSSVDGTPREMAPGQFKFDLKDEEGQVVSVGENDSAGNVVFPDMIFGMDDVGVHSYTITEQNLSKPGIVYDEHEESVTVVVDEPVGRNLNVKVFYGDYDEDTGTYADPENPAEAVFENIYDVRASLRFSVHKELTGAELQDGQFPFSLYDPDGYKVMNPDENEVASARNDSEGNVVFPEVYLDVSDFGDSTEKDFIYMIMETPEDDNVVDEEEADGESSGTNDASDRWKYDRHICYVIVHGQLISYEDGTQEIVYTTEYRNDIDDTSGENRVDREGEPGTAVIGNADVFSNIYYKKGGVKILKVDENGVPMPEVGFAIFSEETGAQVANIVTDDNGIAQTDEDELNSGRYFIVEISAPEGYGMHELKVPFEIVEDGLLDLTGQPLVNYPKEGDASIHFEKQLVNATLQSGAFAFRLLDSSGNIVGTATNDALGNVFFNVHYKYGESENVLGEHRYTIEEVIGPPGDIVYDSEAKSVVVTVRELPTKLSCTLKYE